MAKIVAKGVVSEYIRNDVHSRFAEREGRLIAQYRNSAGLLTRRIEAVQRFAPFRATADKQQFGPVVHANIAQGEKITEWAK